MIQVKGKMKNTERDKSEWKKRFKKTFALGCKIGTCITMVEPKFYVYGKNGERERERE